MKTKNKRELLMDKFPLLQIVNDTRFNFQTKMLFKADIICHGGFDKKRKDIETCKKLINAKNIY